MTAHLNNDSSTRAPLSISDGEGRGVRATKRITATYFIETPLPPEKAAEILAGEQSSGTVVAVPVENFGYNSPLLISTFNGYLYE